MHDEEIFVIRGVSHFIQAFFFLLASPARRAWLISQFLKALLCGLILLFVSFSFLAALLYLAFEYWNLQSYWAWLTGIGFIIGWGVALFFGAGPIALLGASIYLSERANWRGLRQASCDVFQEQGDKVHHSIWKSIPLVLLMLVALPLGFIPFLAWINILLAAYALGQEWVWAAEEEFGKNKLVSFTYKMGLGLIPAMIAAVPILGVLSLPFLQTACLWDYSRNKRGGS